MNTHDAHHRGTRDEKLSTNSHSLNASGPTLPSHDGPAGPALPCVRCSVGHHHDGSDANGASFVACRNTSLLTAHKSSLARSHSRPPSATRHSLHLAVAHSQSSSKSSVALALLLDTHSATQHVTNTLQTKLHQRSPLNLISTLGPRTEHNVSAVRHSASTNWNATRGAQDGLGEASRCCLLVGRTFLCIIIHETSINTHSRGMRNGQTRRRLPALPALSGTPLNTSIHYKTT